MSRLAVAPVGSPFPSESRRARAAGTLVGGYRGPQHLVYLETVEERALPGLGRQYSSPRGRLDLFAAGPLLVLRFSDHGEGDFATPIIAAFDAISGRGDRVEMFFEMGGMFNYDSALRTRLTVHFVRHRPKIGSLHVFTRSRIVSMGVSVANLALGLITVHPDMKSFTGALDQIAKRTRTIGISGNLLAAS